jgi:hypothetical protein
MATCPKCQSTNIIDGACDDCGAVMPNASMVTAPASPPGLSVTQTRTNRATRATTRSSIIVSLQSQGSTTSKRVQTTRGSTSRRNALGGGLISLPLMPSNKPLDLLMADPVVPQHKRICQGQVADPSNPSGPKISCFEPNQDNPNDTTKPTVLKREKGVLPALRHPL